MKLSTQSFAAVALISLLGSAASHAAGSSAARALGNAPFDSPSAGSLFAPYTGTAASSGALISSFGSVVSGPLGGGTAATPIAAPLYPPFASVAADAAEARSFTSGTLAASLYTLIAGGIGNASTGTYLDGTPIAAAAPPQAYALLLAGLLAIGFILRRRFD